MKCRRHQSIKLPISYLLFYSVMIFFRYLLCFFYSFSFSFSSSFSSAFSFSYSSLPCSSLLLSSLSLLFCPFFSHLHFSRRQIAMELNCKITIDQEQHTFSFHFPEVEFSSHSIAPSTKSIDDGVINSRIWC